MNHEFRLADIGEGLEEAEIIEWKVQVGDRVQRDQTIVEVMTDKSNAELPAPVGGVIVALGATVGDRIEVGAVLAVIDPTIGEEPEPIPGSSEPVTRPATPPVPEPAAPASTVSTFQVAAATAAPGDPYDTYRRPKRAKASPTTRVEAARRGIDLDTVTGTGPGGRILLTDLEGAAPGSSSAPEPDSLPEPAPEPDSVPEPAPPEAPPAEPAPLSPPAPASRPAPLQAADTTAGVTVEPLRGVRRVIARNMHQSWTDIPHIHAFHHIDAEPLLDLRDQLRTSGRTEFATLTPLSFFVAAVATAIEQHPIANASLDLDAETITYRDSINVGVAVAAPQGLVVPVLRDAGNQALASIAAAVRSTVDGARAGSLPASAFRDGTVTITNFGSLGGEQALPLIRPPESVIFGFGSIKTRPFVLDDTVVARKTMHLVIATDHRLLDGDVTTALLGRVASLLENPINLVLSD